MVLFLLPAVAHGTPIVTLTLDPSDQSVEQGGTLTFAGTFDVSGDPDPIFLAGDSFNVSLGFVFDAPAPDSLFVSDAPFFAGPPQIDFAGSPWHFDLFTVDVGALVVPGDYIGTFNVLGGTDPSLTDPVASAEFKITVTESSSITPVPEPATIVLLSTGVATLGIRRRLRRAKE